MWILVIVAALLLWLMIPVLAMIVLNEHYTRQWDSHEKRLLAYIDGRVAGRHAKPQTAELPDHHQALTSSAAPNSIPRPTSGARHG